MVLTPKIGGKSSSVPNIGKSMREPWLPVMKHGCKIPQQLRAQLLYKGGNLCHPCDGAGDVQCAGGFWDSGEIVVGTVAHAWNGSKKSHGFRTKPGYLFR